VCLSPKYTMNNLVHNHTLHSLFVAANKSYLKLLWACSSYVPLSLCCSKPKHKIPNKTSKHHRLKIIYITKINTGSLIHGMTTNLEKPLIISLYYIIIKFTSLLMKSKQNNETLVLKENEILFPKINLFLPYKNCNLR